MFSHPTCEHLYGACQVEAPSEKISRSQTRCQIDSDRCYDLFMICFMFRISGGTWVKAFCGVRRLCELAGVLTYSAKVGGRLGGRSKNL